jgi:antitoxin component YwqK of YwqJK toxin-antitoxin module
MDINNLIERNGLLYTLNDNKSYTGKVFSFNEKGHKESEMTYKDGKKDGKWTYWHENGQKELEVTLKDGEFISSKCWDEYGNECECDVLGYIKIEK